MEREVFAEVMREVLDSLPIAVKLRVPRSQLPWLQRYNRIGHLRRNISAGEVTASWGLSPSPG
jgi:hypothetical protein